jgi:predicted ABC-type sugar transport system permease subunit
VNRSTVLAIALAFVSIWVVMAAGTTAVWLTGEVRVVGLVMLPTAVVASLLVLYFDWRAKLQRRILAERDERPDLNKPA